MLLILEVIGLVLLGGYEFLQVDWRGINLGSLQDQAVEVAVFALFVPSAVLTLLSALSFLRTAGGASVRDRAGADLAGAVALLFCPPVYVYRSWPTAYVSSPQLPGRKDGVRPDRAAGVAETIALAWRPPRAPALRTCDPID